MIRPRRLRDHRPADVHRLRAGRGRSTFRRGRCCSPSTTREPTPGPAPTASSSELGFNAVMFVDVGRVDDGDPEYLTWPELETVQDERPLAAPAPLGRGPPADPYGPGDDDYGPFYAYEEQGEDFDGWRKRGGPPSSGARRRSPTTSRAYRPLAFAPGYGTTARTAPTTRRSRTSLLGWLTQRYDVVFTQDVNARARPGSGQPLGRLQITRATRAASSTSSSSPASGDRRSRTHAAQVALIDERPARRRRRRHMLVRRGDAAGGDQARPADPRAGAQRALRAGGALDRPARADGRRDLRTGRDHRRRAPVGRRYPFPAQRARGHAHAAHRRLRLRPVRRPTGREGDDRAGRRRRLSARHPRARRHELRLRCRAGLVPPAHPRGSRGGGPADRRPQPDAVPGGAEPPAHHVYRGAAPRADGEERGEPRARECQRGPGLRDREHGDRRSALGRRPRRPDQRSARRRGRGRRRPRSSS